MFWKKNTPTKAKVILGMVMLADIDRFRTETFVEDYKRNYIEKIGNVTRNEATIIITIENENIAIGEMPVPIPSGDLEHAASYAYNWPSALEDAAMHKSHLIVSSLDGSENQIERFRIFTQVACSILRTTNSIGMYLGSQSMLIPKDDYIAEAALMSADYFPLNIWIYFGLHASNAGNSGYTYGLTEFGKSEIEIKNSKNTLQDVRGFLFNIAHYVLEYDVVFKDGQTVGLSKDERIPVTYSRGEYVKGKTFKLAY